MCFNFQQVVPKTTSIFQLITILIISILITSCSFQTLGSGNDVPNDTPISNPTKQDTCCEVKYPATQADVSGIDLFQKQFQLVSFRDPSTGNFKYKLSHSPSPSYESVSQAYVNYLGALYPCITGTGSTWRLSKDNFSSGHTTRQVTRENWIGFTSGPSGSTMTINDPSNFWTDYFEPPISIGAPATPAVNGGLYSNVIYSIEYGFWVDGDCNLSQKEQECLGYHTSVNIRIQAASTPLSRAENSKAFSTIEYLDDNGNIIDSKKVETTPAI